MIDRIRKSLQDQGYDTSGPIDGYIKQRDFPRAAKGLHDLDANLYRKSMIDQIDPRVSKGQPPIWFRYIAPLFAPIVATTNWDNLVEDSTKYRRMDWLTDPQALLEQRQSNRPSVFHVHGHIQKFDSVVHTNDEYGRFNGADGNNAREFLGRLAEVYSFLFVGYSIEDPFITDVVNTMSRTWGAQPEFYKLHPNPSSDDRQRAREGGVTLLHYDKESAGSHAKGIDACLGEVCDLIDIERPKIPEQLPAGILSRSDELVEITDEFIGRVQPPSPDALRRFYRGSPGGWAHVVHQKTAKRAAVDRILRTLETELGVALIGAGGEGKSTILKQIALERRRKGWKVLYIEDAIPSAIDAAFDQLKGDRTNPILLCIDQADSTENLLGLMRFANNRRNTTNVVLACREYQWHQRRDVGELRKYIAPISTGRLNVDESREIARLLVDSGTLVNPEDDVDTLTKRLRDDDNHFLLSAMLYATEGRPLKAIIASVLDDIAEGENGERLLTMIAFVAALEVRQGRGGRPFFCSQNLFKEAFALSTAAMKRLVNSIRGEVSLTPRGEQSIETRHPIIASVIVDNLFADGGLLDELEVLKMILAAAGRLSMENPKPAERNLLGAIPDCDQRLGRSIQHLRQLYQFSTEGDPRRPPVWQAWALMEKEAGNTAKARELFEIGTRADPSHAHSWQAWALMEKEAGNTAKANFLLDKLLSNCGRIPEAVRLEAILKDS